MFNMRTLAIILASTLACGSALAQWQWVDASGRKVYSDTAPPREIPDKSILQRPGAAAPTVAPVEQPATATTSPAPVALNKPAGVDVKLDAKKKEAEQAEAAKREAEAAKREQARADNCKRAKSAKATLDSGVRMRTTNAKGEQVVMDDESRAVESKRIQGIIDSDCGAAPVSAASSAPVAK